MNTTRTQRKQMPPWMGQMDIEHAAQGWVVHPTGLASDDTVLAELVEDMGWEPHDPVITAKSMLIQVPLDKVASFL